MLDKVKQMNYSDYGAPLLTYDASIASHVYIDACNASIVRYVLQSVRELKGAVILDAGCGTGQVSRLLNALGPAQVEACDVDPQVKDYFKQNPETCDIHYFEHDIVNHALPSKYDVAVLRGVYHHIPKSERVRLIETLLKSVETIIIADEGILEYSTERERLLHCNIWYSFVINEAKRRGLDELVEMESRFLEHESLGTADDGGDLKESPACVVQEVVDAGGRVLTVDRLGNWDVNKGGFYTIVVKK